MTAPKTYYVRLKPYNKRRGFLCVNYMTNGVRFTTRWKEVSARKARELETLCQPHDTDYVIPLFDIKTKEEALAIEEEERDSGVPAVARVKDAERVPDKAFRDDKPEIKDELDEIESSADTDELLNEETPKAAAKEYRKASPAPSLRGGAKTRG